MSEQDLGLKIGSRRLLWSMGYSTRVDVVLRGFSSTGGDDANRRPPESFTDLDVLGVTVVPGNHLVSAIADCKTGRRDSSTSRMFWLRGVADLFGAQHAYLVREHAATDAARQLSSRLGITVLTSEDLIRMQGFYSDQALEPAGSLAILFDRGAVAKHLAAFTSLDRRLRRLLDYRNFDYWIYEERRNPIQMVAHLQGARKHLQAKDPTHLALFLDLAWMYLLTLIHLTEHVRRAYLADPDRGLQEYLFGGAAELSEKKKLAELLASLAPDTLKDADLNYLPPYYSSLRELVTRLLRRPAHLQTALRYVEAASAFAAARQRVTLAHAFEDSYDPVAAKLVADVAGFLTAAADLDPDFRPQARAFLLAEPIPATTRTIRASGNAGPRPTNSGGREIGDTGDARHSTDEGRQLPLPEPEHTP